MVVKDKMIKKINLTVLTNPLIFNSDRAEMLISNACVGFDSLDLTKYSVDLKFLFWNAFTTFDNLCDALEIDRYDNLSLEWENFNNSIFKYFYGDLKKILDITIKNIKQKDNRLDILNEISIETCKENYELYGANQQFRVLTDDIRSSMKYDMYFWMSSRYIFNEFDYLTSWVDNFEKYPKLPFYCNWSSWTNREKQQELSSHIDINSEIFIETYAGNHVFSVRPKELIQFIERDLFEEDVLEYCKYDENGNVAGEAGQILRMHLGSDLFGKDGIRIKNRKNVQGKDDSLKVYNTLQHSWTIKYLIEDYYAFLSKRVEYENGDVVVKGCYEQGLQFFILFEQYMIKSGYKKFDIDLIDFGSIKIPASSMDGPHPGTFGSEMRHFLWEPFNILFEYVFYLNDKLNLNFLIEQRNEYEILNKVYDFVFEKKQMNGIKDVFKKNDISTNRELRNEISNIFKEFIIYYERKLL